VPNKDGTLKAREFLFLCEDIALAGLPADFPAPQRKLMWTILQFSYGDAAVHFELQPQVSRGVVELGLHFEGPAEVNEARALAVAERTPEIAPVLGEGWEMEEWTASWRRLHRSFPFTRLTAALAREVGEQACTLLRSLQPLVSEMPPVAAAPARGRMGEGAKGRGRFHNRAKARR
jgi:hypothetical protein